MTCATAKHAETAIFARENDIITCERGHPLYRIASDLYRGVFREVHAVEKISPRAPEPVQGVIIINRCACGARWRRTARWLDSTARLYEVHFEDGWR